MAVHVSHAALPFPVKGARFSFYIPYLDADGDPTAPTTPDTEITKDAAAAGDCTEEASAVSGMDGLALMTLTGDETNCSAVGVNAKVASGPKATLATFYPRVMGIVSSGTAQAGAAGTITLAAAAPSYDLSGCIVKTTGGTGGGGGSGSLNNQARVITAYNISTKVATVVPNWETNPSSDTTYEILSEVIGPAGVAGAVWEEILTTSLRNITNSAGQRLRRASAIATDGSVNDAAATTTSFIVGGTITTNDFFNDQVIVFTSGALAGQARPVLDYDGATKTITLDEPLTSAPANGVEFVLIPTHVHPIAQIVDGMWDEALAGHTTAGTAGKALSDAGSAGDPWATALPGAYGAGTAGKIVGDNVNAPVGDVPTNAELATALAGADDAVLASIAALNNLSSAGAQSAAAAALAAYNAATAADVTAVAGDVWDEALSGHLGAGSTGEALSNAGSAGDPWATDLPGTYDPGTAGAILGGIVVPSNADIAEAVVSIVIEEGANGPITPAMVLRAVLAYFAGDVDGGGTSQIDYLSQDGVRVRISQRSVDEFGNREGSILDLDV